MVHRTPSWYVEVKESKKTVETERQLVRTSPSKNPLLIPQQHIRVDRIGTNRFEDLIDNDLIEREVINLGPRNLMDLGLILKKFPFDPECTPCIPGVNKKLCFWVDLANPFSPKPKCKAQSC